MSNATEKARLLYAETRDIRLSEIPAIDIKDRLAIATVVAGLRPVGVLEGEGLQLERIRDALISHGLPTLVTRGVWIKGALPKEHPNLEYLPLLDKYSKVSNERVLWFCADTAQRNALKNNRLTKEEAGIVLGYPPCCVRWEIENSTKYSDDFLSAIIAKVGRDKNAIDHALRDDLPVEMSAPDFSNLGRTDEQFPFALHIACDACLNSVGSPSAVIHNQNKELALKLDPALHDAILSLAKMHGRLSNASESEREIIFAEMERLRSRLSKAI